MLFRMAKSKRGAGRGKPAKRWLEPPKLKAWRVYRGMTVEGLAEQAGVSPGLVSQIENGDSNGSPDSLQKLAKALKCEVWQLFEEPPPTGFRRLDIPVPEAEFDRITAAVLALIGRR